HDGMICLGSVSNGILDKFFVRGVGIADGTGDVIAEMRRDTGGSWTPHYYVANHRGDTVLVYDQNQQNEYYARYDAFGNASQTSGTFTPRYTFSTKEYLTDAKLYLYAYRVYDPIAGRWTQRDPIDYQDSPNLYQFCGNNPLNMVDILGMEISEDDQERLASFVEPDQVQNAYAQGKKAYAKGGNKAVKEYFAHHSRYAYNKDLGWIDMQHVVCAAGVTEASFPLAGSFVGYLVELAQLVQGVNPFQTIASGSDERKNDWHSALKYEDVLSNTIGDVSGYKAALPQPLNLVKAEEARKQVDK
ncbi:MAG: RHS repeat-associated core domain-containing protein, partial [bacterium]|nr:RHS repeat-associated core domain-containing protein [bacterium]